jgi:hypothetical protein
MLKLSAPWSTDFSEQNLCSCSNENHVHLQFCKCLQFLGFLPLQDVSASFFKRTQGNVECGGRVNGLHLEIVTQEFQVSEPYGNN